MEKELAKEILKKSYKLTISNLIYDFIKNKDKSTMIDLIEKLRPFFKAYETLDDKK